MLYPLQNDFRNKLELSGIWDFQPDPEGLGVENKWFNSLPDSRPMAVPGSWNEQYEDIFNYFGLSWYLKRVYVPPSWQGQRIFIRVGSANYFSTVFINGIEVGSHEGGHLPFAFDITDFVKWEAENIIAINVENELKPTRVPSGNMGSSLDAAGLSKGYPATTFDFFPYAGLHRPVVIYALPSKHIEDVTIVTEIDGTDGIVHVTVQINNDAGIGKIVLAGGEHEFEESLQFSQGKTKAAIHVPDAHFWSDKDPFLYDLTVLTDSDRYTLKIGVRSIEVKGSQILLNGEPVQLNGFGRHEDFYASGRGLNLPLMIKDYQLMRWTGANSYRTSHYPYSEEEMMLADQEGFLIINELPAVSLQFDNEANMTERQRMCIQQLDELIARDKNHPSVIMWSVANEPMAPNEMARFTSEEEDDPIGKAAEDFLTSLVRHAQKLDPTRLVTLVGEMSSPLTWFDSCDVVCLNRYWGWYFKGGELDKGLMMLDQELDAVWDAAKKPIIVTEFGADTQPGLHGHPAVMWTEEYQANFIRGYLETAVSKPFVAGMQVWNFADFAAVQSITRVGGMNMKGVFTRARQPKMAAHVLREFWTKEPEPLVQEKLDSDGEQNKEPEIQAVLEGLAQQLDGKKPDMTTIVKFDFYEDGIFRLVINEGVCRIESEDGDAAAMMQLKSSDARKLFAGEMDPMMAVMAGTIKVDGDLSALMFLQDWLG